METDIETDMKVKDILDVLEQIIGKRFSHTSLYKWRDKGTFPKPWTLARVEAFGEEYMNPKPKIPYKKMKHRVVVPNWAAKDIMAKTGLSRYELAQRLNTPGASESMLSRIFNDDRKMTIELFEKIKSIAEVD